MTLVFPEISIFQLSNNHYMNFAHFCLEKALILATPGPLPHTTLVAWYAFIPSQIDLIKVASSLLTIPSRNNVWIGMALVMTYNTAEV